MGREQDLNLRMAVATAAFASWLSRYGLTMGFEPTVFVLLSLPFGLHQHMARSVRFELTELDVPTI